MRPSPSISPHFLGGPSSAPLSLYPSNVHTVIQPSIHDIYLEARPQYTTNLTSIALRPGTVDITVTYRLRCAYACTECFFPMLLRPVSGLAPPTFYT